MSDQAIYHILETRRVEAGLEMFRPMTCDAPLPPSMLDNGEDIVTVKGRNEPLKHCNYQKYDRPRR